MSHPVSRWIWCRALRDHWPSDPAPRTTLLFLATYMDGKDAVAWPSEKTLAEKTGSTDRTVRRHLKRAMELGFLDRSIGHKRGQGWRVTVYQATVPDWIELSELEETIVASDSGVVRGPARGTSPAAGSVPRGELRGTSDVPRGVPRNVSTTGHLEHGQPDTGTPNNRTFGTQQPDIRQPDTTHAEQPDTRAIAPGVSAENVSVTAGSEQPDTATGKHADNPQNKSSSEVVIRSLQGEARSETAPGRVISTREKRTSEPESIAERERKALKLLTIIPNATPEQLRPYGLPPDRIAELRQLAETSTAGEMRCV